MQDSSHDEEVIVLPLWIQLFGDSLLRYHLPRPVSKGKFFFVLLAPASSPAQACVSGGRVANAAADSQARLQTAGLRLEVTGGIRAVT